MPEAGYVYALINPSMAGLVKVGKTTRTPEERAKELSASTGVPIPFMVAFYETFSDCTLAEEYVHAKLESLGCRHSDNREFFLAELNVVTRAILEAKDALSKTAINAMAPVDIAEYAVTENDEVLTEADRATLAFTLIDKYNALFNGAVPIINAYGNTDDYPDYARSLTAFQNAFNQYSAVTAEALLAAEDDLTQQWGLIVTVFPDAMGFLDTSARPAEQLDVFNEALEKLSLAMNDLDARQSVLQLSIAFGYACIAMKTYIEILSVQDFDMITDNNSDEIRSVYDNSALVTRSLYDALRPALGSASECTGILLDIISIGEDEDDDEKNMQHELQMLFHEHDLMGVIMPALTKLAIDVMYAQLSDVMSGALENAEDHSVMPWDVVLSEAEDCLYGDDLQIPDERRALSLYKRAAKLGSSEAYMKVADLLATSDGSANALKQGVAWLNEGVNKGFMGCCLALSDIYSGRDIYYTEEYKNHDNAIKCYRRFFKNASLTDFDDRDLFVRLKQYLQAIHDTYNDTDSTIVRTFVRHFREQLEEGDSDSAEDRSAKLSQLNAVVRAHAWVQ